jgi:hypothetical protein
MGNLEVRTRNEGLCTRAISVLYVFIRVIRLYETYSPTLDAILRNLEVRGAPGRTVSLPTPGRLPLQDLYGPCHRAAFPTLA